MSRTARRLFKPPHSDSDDDSLSDASSAVSLDDLSVADQEPMTVADTGEALDTALDMVLEKRTSTREEALEKLTRLMGMQNIAEHLEGKQDTVLDYALRCARKEKSPAENKLAARVLSMLFITLGPHQEQKYRELWRALSPLIAATSSRPSAVKAALIDTLSVACFISGDEGAGMSASGSMKVLTIASSNGDDEDGDGDAEADDSNSSLSAVDRLLKILETWVRKYSGANSTTTSTNRERDKERDERVIASALRGLGLLATTLGRSAAHALFTRTLPHHLALIESSTSTSDIRITAGENVALFYELLNDPVGHSAASSNQSSPSHRAQSITTSFSAMDLSHSAASTDANGGGQQHNGGGAGTVEIAPAATVSTGMSRSHSEGSLLRNAAPDTHHLSDETCIAFHARVLAAFAGMQAASVKSVAKRDRSFQKSAFRDIQLTVEAGGSPHLRLKFKKETVIFGTWVELKRLYAFREALGQSLHMHFLYNPLLRDLFDVHMSYDATLSNQERRAMYNPSSEASKMRTKHLHKQRGVKASSRSHSFGDD
ncbi:Interferon- developmental regulator 1 [Sorochytrium milnesiophthora]